MSSVVAGKFTCDTCGRRYTWKPQLAGKRSKCACGAALVVPQTDAPQGESAEDDLYDIADRPAPSAAPTTASPSLAISRAFPTGPQDSASSPRTIDYRTKRGAARSDVVGTRTDRFFFDRLTDPTRDLYIPCALLGAGFLSMLAWALLTIGGGAIVIGLMSLFVTVGTVVKTAALILLAFAFAPVLGISFGEARTAILKFAAIVVFTDAALLWLEEIMDVTIGRPASGRMAGRMIWVSLLASAALISFLCHYLFDMDGEETGYFAVPWALVSWVLGLVVNVVIVAILTGLLAATRYRVATTPAAPASTTAPTPITVAVSRARPPATMAPSSMPAGGVRLNITDADRTIEQQIQSGLMLKEGREYNRSRVSRKAAPDLIDQLYAAGAERVYLDIAGQHVYVRLPDADAAARKRCVDACTAYASANGLSAAGIGDAGQRFLVVGLKQ